jgi:hypothetical protein
VFCEHCGLQFWPQESVCTRCGVTSTRHWLQLMSLMSLTVAAACNSLVALTLLPRLVTGHPPHLLFRAWSSFNHHASSYGWIPIALGLFAWNLRAPRGSKSKVMVSALVLLAGVAPVVSWCLPAGQRSAGILAAIDKNPGLPSAAAWGIIALVFGVLCLKPETRDSLLGHGRTLSLLSLGLLLLVLVLTLVGWSATYSWAAH